MTYAQKKALYGVANRVPVGGRPEHEIDINGNQSRGAQAKCLSKWDIHIFLKSSYHHLIYDD